jgi:hypothetical protein
MELRLQRNSCERGLDGPAVRSRVSDPELSYERSTSGTRRKDVAIEAVLRTFLFFVLSSRFIYSGARCYCIRTINADARYFLMISTKKLMKMYIRIMSSTKALAKS